MSQPLEIAAVPSRVLAAIMDYIVLTAAFVLAVRLVPHPDYSFAASFLTSLIYFSLVHSALCRGQSLGKRVFGLRVVRATGAPIFLTPMEAGLRYCHYLGWIVLCTELPPLYFRAMGTVAAPMLLDLNMLFVLLYFFVNVAALIADPKQRALHDYFAGTAVIRGGNDTPASPDVDAVLAAPAAAGVESRRRIIIGAAAVLGCVFWYFGLNSNPRISKISSHRYELEHRFPVRLVSVGFGEDSLMLDVLRLETGGGDGKQLAAEVGKYFLDQGVIVDTSMKKIRISFYSDPADSSPASTKQIIELDLPSLSATEIQDSPPVPAHP